MNELDTRGHIDFSDFESGFYPVKEDDGWTVMFWDGGSCLFLDHIQGQYDPHDPSTILDISDRIELPGEYDE